MLVSNDMFNRHMLQIFMFEYCAGCIATFNKQTRTVSIVGKLNPLLWTEKSKKQLSLEIKKLM